MVLRGSSESYDSLKSRYDFGNMSFTKLKSVYKQRTGNAFEDTDYESFGLIDEKGNLTNAGALLAGSSFQIVLNKVEWTYEGIWYSRRT